MATKYDDVQQAVIERIIDAMANDTAPWRKPWDANVGASIFPMPRNGKNKRLYTKENALYLMLAMEDKGATDPRFYTFNQATSLGYSIKAGSKGYPVRQGYIVTKDKDGNPLPESQYYPKAQVYVVFHASDICIRTPKLDADGNKMLGPKLDADGNPVLKKDGTPVMVPLFEEKPIPPYVPSRKPYTHDELNEIAEEILKNSKAVIYHDQADRNYYIPSKDEIHLTPQETYPEIGEYYATALHELSHWTGHSSRLNRPIQNQFGSKAYALEECTVEFASALLSAMHGINSSEQNHVSYIKSWASVLKENKKEVMGAIQNAIKISDYLSGFAREKIQQIAKANNEAADIDRSKIPDTIQFEILQLDSRTSWRFAAFDDIRAFNAEATYDAYTPKYLGYMKSGGSLENTLERIYIDFNSGSHPTDNFLPDAEDIRMRNVSVSDLIRVNDRLFYVDDIGFKELELPKREDMLVLRPKEKDTDKKLISDGDFIYGKTDFEAYNDAFNRVFQKPEGVGIEQEYNQYISTNLINYEMSSINPGSSSGLEAADIDFAEKYCKANGGLAALPDVTDTIRKCSPYEKLVAGHAETLSKAVEKRFTPKREPKKASRSR